MLAQWLATVADGGLTLNQHRFYVTCLLGFQQVNPIQFYRDSILLSQSSHQLAIEEEEKIGFLDT